MSGSSDDIDNAGLFVLHIRFDPSAQVVNFVDRLLHLIDPVRILTVECFVLCKVLLTTGYL